jgi:hypothetical protein
MEAKMKSFSDDMLKAKDQVTGFISEAWELGDLQLMDGISRVENLLSEIIRVTGDMRVRYAKYGGPRTELEEMSGERSRGPRKRARAAKRVTAADATAAPPDPGEYPKFFREDDRLVKKDWSVAKGKVYRHTCSIDDAIRLAIRIEAAGRDGEPFKIREVLESLDKSMRNYQVYAVIDWLKKEGLLKYDERGYSLGSVEDLASEIGARFRQLPERG